MLYKRWVALPAELLILSLSFFESFRKGVDLGLVHANRVAHRSLLLLEILVGRLQFLILFLDLARVIIELINDKLRMILTSLRA